MGRSCYNRIGFTLIEAMIAMVILTIAAGGVLIPFSSAASIHVEGSRRTTASRLSSDLLEEITISLNNEPASTYDGAVATWDAFSEAEGQVMKIRGESGYTGDVYKYFSRKATCQEASLGSGHNITVLGAWVTVTVSFDGREMSTLKTLVSKQQ
jgi:prepilin-type N-terminal cleavage/methylation domain-containing protein